MNEADGSLLDTDGEARGRRYFWRIICIRIPIGAIEVQDAKTHERSEFVVHNLAATQRPSYRLLYLPLTEPDERGLISKMPAATL